MSQVKDLQDRLTKLQQHSEKIREAMLGEDWETQMEMRYLLNQVKEEIHKTIELLKQVSLVS